MNPNAFRELARFSSRVSLASCPSYVIEKARALLLYGVGVGVASVGAPGLARVGSALRAEYGSGGPATCFTDASLLAPGAAAFANGVLFHVRIQDDAHPAGHMGTVILPAALAMAETQRSSGAQLIEAIISGYEVALRIGRDHAVDLSERGFRTTPIYGAIGAAAACARLLGVDADRTLSALALTTHAAAGLREFADAGTDEYPYQAGFAARSGLTSALLAAEGVEGTATALTGRAGLYRAFGRADKDYAYRVVEGLGTHYETGAVTYKPYPGGQFHRGVIRGFAALRKQTAGSKLASAAVHLHPFEANYLGLAYKGPFCTYSQAFFSVPFCAALAWLYGTVTFANLHRFDDAAVLDIVAPTSVVSDPSRERYRPLIRITLQDGSVIDWLDDAGEEGYELTWSRAVEMTRALCEEAHGLPQTCEALIRSAERIDTMQSIEPFITAAKNVVSGILARV